MTTTLFELIEDVLGEVTPRRLDKLVGSGHHRLRRYWKPLRELADAGGVVPPRAPADATGGFLRPYLGHRPDLPAGDGLDQGIERDGQQLCRQLLYCHSVAIADPLTSVVDGYFQMRKYTSVNDDYYTSRLWGGIRWVAAMRPLLRDRTVVLLPPDRQWYHQWWYRRDGGQRAPEYFSQIIGDPEKWAYSGGGGAADLDLPVDQYGEAILTDGVREFMRRSDRESTRRPLVQAVEQCARLAGKFIRHDGRIDFYLRDGEMFRLALAEVLAQEALVPAVDLAVLESLRINQLGTLPVPALDRIPLASLIELHRHADLFTEWRIALGKGLDQVATQLRSGTAADEQRARRALVEAVWPTLQRFAATDPGLGLLHGGVQQLVVGALSAAVAVVSQSPTAALSTAAGTAGVTTAWTFWATRPQRQQARLARSMQELLTTP